MKSCHLFIASRSIQNHFICSDSEDSLKGPRPLLQSPAPAEFILGLSTHLWAFIHPHQKNCLKPRAEGLSTSSWDLLLYFHCTHGWEIRPRIQALIFSSQYIRHLFLHNCLSPELCPYTVAASALPPALDCLSGTSAFTHNIVDSIPRCLVWKFGKYIFLKIICLWKHAWL